MPDHIHLFCSPNMEMDWRLAPWIASVKSHITKRWPERTVLKPWLSDHWDTQMRSQNHYLEKLSYVYENPVRAGLSDNAQSWPYAGRIHSLIWD